MIDKNYNLACIEENDTVRPIVSVCISVYNGEAHLRKCLDSVISQDIDCMEIVLVNDGSTDSTSEIMYEYRDRFPGIRIIEQENRGLAQGRWTGVKNSNGRYITFLDVDDYLLEGAYKTILQFMADTRADIYEFQTIREDYYSKSPYTGIIDAGQVLADYFDGASIPVNYWLRWFKRELFSESVFPDGISLHEDVYGFPCLLNRADTIAYIGMPLHVHTKTPGSIMNTHNEKRNTREYFEKQKLLLLSIPHIASNIGQNVIDTEYKESFSHYAARIYRNFVFMTVKDVSYNEKLDAIIDTLGLKMSRRELERFISQNVGLQSRLNRVIHLFGLRDGYLLYGLRNKLSHSLVSRIYYKTGRLSGRLRYKADMVSHPEKTKCLCPCCGMKFREFKDGFFLKRPGRYDPKRYVNVDQYVLCPICGSLPRHRILAAWCEKHTGLLRKSAILYFAPESSMMMWMRRNRVRCTTADLFHKADLALDIQKTGLPDGSYDLVIANHVLEHVDDFRAALKEIGRILRPGGLFICSFPMDPKVETLDEDESIKTDEMRYERYGQVDHRRVFGLKAGRLLAEAGFSVKAIKGRDYPKEILPVVGPADYDINQLFCCKKSRMEYK